MTSTSFHDFCSRFANGELDRDDSAVKRKLGAILGKLETTSRGREFLLTTALYRVNITNKGNVEGLINRLKEGKATDDVVLAFYYHLHLEYWDTEWPNIVDRIAFAGSTFEEVAGYPVRGKNSRHSNNSISVELTDEERELIVDQIARIRDDGLTNFELFCSQVSTKEATILANLQCRNDNIDLICEGFRYDYRISLSEVKLEFQTEGLKLKETHLAKNSEKDGEINQITYFRGRNTPIRWELTIESKTADQGLKGLLLSGEDDVIFYAEPIKGADTHTISAKHRFSRGHLNVVRIKNHRNSADDRNKGYLIEECIAVEAAKVLDWQSCSQSVHFRKPDGKVEI